MKKRFYLILLSLIVCIALLSACGEKEGQGSEADNVQVSNGSEENKEENKEENVPSEQVNANEGELKEEPKEEVDTPEVESTETQDSSYTVKVKAPFDIYKNPEYDSILVDTVWEKGLFTIVEEQEDEEGNLWGKLKSGLGWICLSRVEKDADLAVRAALIEKNEIPKGSMEVIFEESEYMVRLAFVANETLKDVRFTSIYLTDDGLVDDTLHTIKTLNEGQVFVAGVVFAGDMTTFGLEFVDADGNTQYYAAYISGRNGELVLQEQESIVQ